MANTRKNLDRVEKMKGIRAQWNGGHREEVRQYQKRYNLEHKEEIRQYRLDHREDKKLWGKNNKEKLRRHSLTSRCKRVGITIEEYDLLPKKCSFAHCAVIKPGGTGDWLLDHDHTTGKFRGLLCHYHNCLLGFAHDNEEELQDAIEYLRYSKPSVGDQKDEDDT